MSTPAKPMTPAPDFTGFDEPDGRTVTCGDLLGLKRESTPGPVVEELPWPIGRPSLSDDNAEVDRPDLLGVVKECAQCRKVHDLGSCPESARARHLAALEKWASEAPVNAAYTEDFITHYNAWIGRKPGANPCASGRCECAGGQCVRLATPIQGFEVAQSLCAHCGAQPGEPHVRGVRV